MSSRRPKTNAVPKEESDTETIQRKEKDPKRSLAKSQKSSVSFGTILRISVIIIGLYVSTSYILTQSLNFGYGTPNFDKFIYKNGWLPPPRTFTLEELKQYDGSEPDMPIYLSVNGYVFDVTSGRDFYGKGKSYSIFAGKDASRAFVAGCMKKSVETYDLRGLDEQKLKDLEGWLDFYFTSPKYKFVGKAILPPIDPSSPIPEECETQQGPPK